MAVTTQKFRIEGLKQLDESLKELTKVGARNTILRTLKKVAQPIADLASQLAPDDPVTGGKDLKSSILVRSVPASQRSSHVEVAVGPSTKAFWGRFQEFGVPHHGPQPFMRPAWDSGAIPALNDIKETLADEIKKTAKRAAAKAAREIAKMK